MDRTLMILDYESVSQKQFNAALRHSYNIINIISYRELEEADIDAILVHVSTSNEMWNRRCLSKFVKLYGKETPLIIYTEFNNPYLDIILHEYRISAVVYLPFECPALLNTIQNMMEPTSNPQLH